MLKKIIIGAVVVALLVVAVLFGGPIFTMVRQVISPPPRLVASPSWDFTVNLVDPGMRRVLRVSMTFKYYTNSKLAAELRDKNAQVRHTVITVLRSRSAMDLLEEGSSAKLQADLVAELNAILEQGDIERIYFTDFVIQ
ncbi:MAG: hypothetical protein DDT35_01177 [Firmicutes bacterium]|nr:hypothetical protein [Bacillota bacterium]